MPQHSAVRLSLTVSAKKQKEAPPPKESPRRSLYQYLTIVGKAKPFRTVLRQSRYAFKQNYTAVPASARLLVVAPIFSDETFACMKRSR